ncbi:MAG: hypothetical protein K940chlam2_01231 [Chlamydiae bacterium]|nr:hypothetical protein [Chlamydiota bacterium]
MDFLNNAPSFAREGLLQSFAGYVEATLGKPKELSYINLKVLEHLRGDQKKELITQLKDVGKLPKEERDLRVDAAVAGVLDLPPQEDPFCFGTLVDEYFDGFERMDYAQKLGKLKDDCEQVRDPEELVKKTLSNFYLDSAIKHWGEEVIGAAKGKYFIQQVQGGTVYLPLAQVKLLNRDCRAIVEQLKRVNSAVINAMKEQFPHEAVEAARLELDPAICTGMQRVDHNMFKAACQTKEGEQLEGEQLEAMRLASKQKAQREFNEMVTGGISEVVEGVRVKSHGAKKYNLPVTVGLISWVSETFTLRQAREYLSGAFAHMGMAISTQVTPREAAQLAVNHQRTIAKADPAQAFRQAILQRASGIQELNMDEFQDLSVDDGS